MFYRCGSTAQVWWPAIWICLYLIFAYKSNAPFQSLLILYFLVCYPISKLSKILERSKQQIIRLKWTQKCCQASELRAKDSHCTSVFNWLELLRTINIIGIFLFRFMVAIASHLLYKGIFLVLEQFSSSIYMRFCLLHTQKNTD